LESLASGHSGAGFLKPSAARSCRRRRNGLQTRSTRKHEAHRRPSLGRPSLPL